jgi:hypothetical protein
MVVMLINTVLLTWMFTVICHQGFFTMSHQRWLIIDYLRFGLSLPLDCIDHLCSTCLLTIDLVDNHIGSCLPLPLYKNALKNSPNHIPSAIFVFILASVLQLRKAFGRFSATKSDFIFLSQLIQVLGVWAQTWSQSSRWLFCCRCRS